MNKNNENLNELLGNLYPDKGQEFLQELAAGERMFTRTEVKPDAKVLEAIKARVASQCKNQKRNKIYFSIAEMVAVAASIIIAAVIWFGMGTTNIDQTQGQFWSSNSSDEAIETQIAQIDKGDIVISDIVFDDDDTNASDNMESELNVISISFWEG